MEGGLQTSPQLGHPIDSSDAKYVSGLSTILVATIQEAKDRISQIEYIFCSQLYPNFQSKYKSLQKIYSEARKAAEETWKENEKDILLQLEKLRFEKQEALEENKSLKSEKENFQILLDSKSSVILNNEKMVKVLEEKNRVLELEVEGLRWEVKQKSKENDGVMERQIKSLQLVQSKVALLANKEKELKEKEELMAELLAKLETMEGKFDELKRELREKTEEVDSGKEFQENLLKKIQLHAKNENILNEYEKEKVKLRVELGEKIEEVQELQKDKRVLMGKLKGLDEKVDKLQVNVRERSNESAEGMELHGKLLRQIEAKDSELISEKKKRRDAFEAYKKLKSQYQFLCKKFGLTSENMLSRTEDESNLLKLNQSPLTSPGIEHKVQNASVVACGHTKNDNNQENLLFQRSNSNSPSSSISPLAPKHLVDQKPGPLSGTKRPVSHWRDTRSHQSRVGPDPHDDFLDTPLENIRGNSKKPAKEVLDLPVPGPRDVNLGSSNDETQDIGIDSGPQKPQMAPSRPSPGGFKYVEPVRKKAERENLKGIECKQCKKFYDAVLPDGGGKDVNSRCEHHDGVSRHRYRYAPPLTPEGFWNIGFESEM